MQNDTSLNLEKAKKRVESLRFHGKFRRVVSLIAIAVFAILYYKGHDVLLWMIIYCFFFISASSKTNESKAIQYLIDQYHLYLRFLTENGIVHIGKLAQGVGQPVEEVQDHINKMIEWGFVVKSDNSAGNLTIAYFANTGVILKRDTEKPAVQERVDSGKKLVSVTCQSCGGITMVLQGERGVCDYCNSSIQG